MTEEDRVLKVRGPGFGTSVAPASTGFVMCLLPPHAIADVSERRERASVKALIDLLSETLEPKRQSNIRAQIPNNSPYHSQSIAFSRLSFSSPDTVHQHKRLCSPKDSEYVLQRCTSLSRSPIPHHQQQLALPLPATLKATHLPASRILPLRGGVTFSLFRLR